MRRALPLSTLVAALTLAAGCASLSESQCIASDWETVGHADGSAGRSSSHLLKHQNACVKHGVVPERAAYHRGWNDGIMQFCTPENGFAQGQRGAAYSNVCPADLEIPFHGAYQEGRQLFVAQSEINDMERQIGYREQRLRHVKAEIRDKETAIVGATLSTIERMHLLDETKELAKEQGELEEAITGLRVDVAVKREQLESMRHEIAYRY